MSLTPTIPPATLSLLPRGNLLLQSQTFDNASWTKLATTITANSTTDPLYGFSTADGYTRTATTASNLLQSVAKAALALAYTFSVYVKFNNVNFVALRLDDGTTSNRADVCFNISTGAISLAAFATGGFSGPVATITAVTAGWSRLTLTTTTNTTTTLRCLISATSVSQQVDGTGSSNSSIIELWGAQLEAYGQASGYAATLVAADPGIWAGTQSLPALPYLPGQDVTVTKAPQWSTKVVKAASGRKRTTAFWPFPLWQFELSYEVIRHRPTQPELFAIWEFFNAAAGQFGPWLFVDPSDCQIGISNPASLGTGDGSTTTFQLQREINSWLEPVYGVYQPIILDNGAPTASTLSFSANGLVTFGTAPTAGHALSWIGYFYFVCQFLQDDLRFEQIVSGLWSGKSLKFESLRA